jgi:hypothetical protein
VQSFTEVVLCKTKGSTNVVVDKEVSMVTGFLKVSGE